MNFRLFLFSDQSLFAELVTRGFPSKWITPYKGERCKVFPSYVSIFLRIFQDGPIPRWVVDYYRKVRSSDLSCQDLRGLRISFTNLQSKVSTEINNQILTLFEKTHSSHFEMAKSRQRLKFDRLLISKEEIRSPTTNIGDINIDRTKWVMNLSDHPLSDSERSVLMKGLNFSVTPSKIPVDEIVAATELACNQLKEKSQAESLRNEVASQIDLWKSTFV